MKNFRHSRVFNREKLNEIEKDLHQSENSPPKSPEEKDWLVEYLCKGGGGRINGCGLTLFGRRNVRSDGTYITTAWFTLAWIPIVPLGSVRLYANTRSFLLVFSETHISGVQEEKLNWAQVVLTYLYEIFCVVWFYGFYRFFIGDSWPSNPNASLAVLAIAFVVPPLIFIIFNLLTHEKDFSGSSQNENL